MKNLNYDVINDLNESSLSVILDGTFTCVHAREFQKFILPLASSWDLYMDLKGVDKMDITGINILVGIHETARKANRSIKLNISTQSNVHRLMELTQMDRRLNISKVTV
ncbi:MAG: STAS domain-containing protein [Saprospiraceae bacterium]|nr:STAS domain-containing protein [Bacteroidia bacterium]NNF21818.1 STAS domain-containing protein [Saprospiraceae bacterium]NNK90250.1 STAS domain-containing protein [Saprospiraceae bacterium]